MPLSKIDIAALRKADDLCVYLSARNPNGLVRLIKRKPYNCTDPFATDIEHVLEGVSVALHGFSGRKELDAGTASCFAMVGLYPRQIHHARCVIETLRVGDEIGFYFYPDAHTNGYIAAADLHGDTLHLQVRRKGKLIADWELTSGVCARNTARMCQNFPVTESYRNNAAERRKCA